MKINRQEPFIVRTTTVVWWWCTNSRYMSIALLRIACKSVSYGNDIARESESSELELGFDLLFYPELIRFSPFITYLDLVTLLTLY